jgi:hypothetical protein
MMKSGRIAYLKGCGSSLFLLLFFDKQGYGNGSAGA